MSAPTSMSQEELDKCRQVAKNLMSEKYKKYNVLFIEPFPLESVPGYLDVVDKKLDIKTLTANLEAGLYHTRQEFFDDAKLIFENAIKYHGNKETKWICKLAKEMVKAVSKEFKNLDKRPSKILTKQKAGSLKIKMGGGSKKKDLSAMAGGAEDASGGGGAAPFAAAAPSLSSAVEGQAGPSSLPSKPKVSLKLKTKDKLAPVKAKPTQPKLKLKISLSKKATTALPDSSNSASTSPKPAAPPGPPTSDGSAKASSSSGVKSEKTPKSQQIRLSGPRGKELPKGVTAPAPGTAKPPKKPTSTGNPVGRPPKDKAAAAAKLAAAKATAGKATTKGPKKTGTKTKKIKKSTSPTPATAVMAPPSSSSAVATPSSGGGAAAMMTPIRKVQCAKVISGLKRRKSKAITWFLLPVSDKNIIQDYKNKIKHPVCISAIQNKLDKNEYRTVAQFVLDLRRIFANCLRYNTSIKDPLRPLAVDLISTAEDLMITFMIRGQNPPPPPGSPDLYPPLVFCWSFCIKVLNTLFNLTNPSDGQPTVYYFLHPVTTYCGGQYPPDYLTLVKKPMDFGTITSNLVEGQYQNVDEFASDCRLVIENCRTFYGGREDGIIFIEHADQLDKVLSQQLDAFDRYLKSSPGLELKAKAATKKSLNGPPLFPKPPGSLLLTVLEDLRGLKYTDKATKITEPAMAPFEKPVSLQDYPDYMQFVQTPMDLQSIERKAKGDLYDMPEDFEFDMTLVFKNCETYNAHRKGDHLVAMSKYGAKQFRRLFTLRMRTFEDPTSVATKEEQKEASINPNKKIKVEAPGVSKGKSAPRISITAAQVTSAAAAAQAAKLKLPVASTNKNRAQPIKANQPVPLHIAIARVKEGYPLRRAHKSLQSWEADCARFFKELMRHPWISAARPKFIYHVPVPVLFPELKDAYMMKIRKPMDLTTVECNLLEGNRYSSADDFVQDVALVFSNAITFNKDGRDIGDPLSIAYYEASKHLLRYSRWLSLELLTKYVADIETVDEDVSEGDDKLPPLSWKLTTGNKKKARTEMESLVMTEPIEKSMEGDRFTWMEAECEKLLKALRHQSDLKQMHFFIAPNFPPDYAAFVSKPMSWQQVQTTLKNREYDTFGEVVADLRLIFSNALKYNARLKGTETTSGLAYDGANFMSAKLEVAINKMLLSASDRLERERIDHANAEREIEAAEQAEEARIRATWKKATTDGVAAPAGAPGAPITDSTGTKIKPVRIKMKRRESTDFEIPFFDEEDDGQHERSYFDAVKQQKALFEKQRQDLAKMRQAAMTTGSAIYARLAQRQKAKTWLGAVQYVSKKNDTKDEKRPEPASNSGTPGASGAQQETSVLTLLEKEGRDPYKIKLTTLAPKKKRKRPAISFD